MKLNLCVKIINFILLVSLISCGDAKKLMPLNQVKEFQPKPANFEADFCTLKPKEVSNHLKFFFSIDISGSNQQTDPRNGNDRRYGNLLDWLNKRVQNDATFYTMLEFADANNGQNAKIPDDLKNADPEYSPFTNDKDLFSNVVSTQRSSSQDNGGTPYKAALDLIIATIRADAQKAKERFEKGEPAIQSDYVVIHLSDGQPTDSDEAELIAKIKNELMTLPNDSVIGKFINQIVLNTGYYYAQGQDIPAARKLLEEMAKAGNGKSYSFDSGAIDYDKLAEITIKQVTTSLSDIIVNNLSNRWEYNNKSADLLLDSDNDFLSDIWELQLGSNPFKADSDDNGLRDGIEKEIYTKPCKDKLCAPDLAHIPSSDCKDSTTQKAKDTDGDGLNDCEERLLTSDDKKVDSNGDNIPDFLAFKFGIPINNKWQDGANTPVDTDWDKVTDFNEIKVNTPPRLDNSKFRNLKPYQYSLSQTSYNPDNKVTCYNLIVDDITFANHDDTVRIFISETENNNTSRKFWRIIDKKAQDFNIYIDEKDFENAKPVQ